MPSSVGFFAPVLKNQKKTSQATFEVLDCFSFELAQRDGRRSSCVMIAYCFLYINTSRRLPLKKLWMVCRKKVLRKALRLMKASALRDSFH